MFSLTWLLFLLGNKAADDMAAHNAANEYCRKVGRDRGRNKSRQIELYNRYLGPRLRGDKNYCSYLSDYDLYVQAQLQLKKEGYVWEPKWDSYIPSKDD